MRIKVECAMRFAHQSMIDALVATASPKYAYVGIDPKSKITMLFDVETDMEATAVCDLTKKICKSTPMGKSATLRVVAD